MGKATFQVRRLVEWAESYEVLVKGAVIGRIFQSANCWKGVDYTKKPIIPCNGLNAAAETLWVLWTSRGPKDTTAW